MCHFIRIMCRIKKLLLKRKRKTDKSELVQSIHKQLFEGLLTVPILIYLFSYLNNFLAFLWVCFLSFIFFFELLGFHYYSFFSDSLGSSITIIAPMLWSWLLKQSVFNQSIHQSLKTAHYITGLDRLRVASGPSLLCVHLFSDPTISCIAGSVQYCCNP